MADGLGTAASAASLSALVASALYVQLHTGSPGAAGTANTSSVTTRQAVTWAAPAAGSVAASNVPAWPNWAGTSGEQVTDVSFWDAPSGGNFQFSAQLSPAQTVHTGDQVNLTALAVAALPGAA